MIKNYKQPLSYSSEIKNYAVICRQKANSKFKEDSKVNIMAVLIKEIISGADLREFVKFPDRLYAKEKNYIPALHRNQVAVLDRGKNPAFEYCEARYWMAYRNNRPVGRIAAIINHRYNSERNLKLMRFGWLDFINDTEVLNGLLMKVEIWAAEMGLTQVHGPLGFVSFDASGVLVEGFDELPTSFGRYNFPYYGPMLESAGYQKEVDWVEYNIKVPADLPQKLIQAAGLVKQRYMVRQAPLNSVKDVKCYAMPVFGMINSSYGDLFGFNALSDRQIAQLADSYFSLLHPDFISIVLNQADEPVGFGLVMPSLAKALRKSGGKLFPFGFLRILWALRFNDTADMLLIGVRPDYQNKGIHALLFEKIFTTMKRRGIRQVETTRELESNIKVQQLWAGYETRQHKRARCYFKTL